MSMNGPLSMDYVYQDSSTQELKNVNIKLSPTTVGDHLDMRLTSADKIAAEDMAKILNELWSEWLMRLRIDPVSDCKITLSAGDSVYNVSVRYLPQISVTGIHPR